MKRKVTDEQLRKLVQMRITKGAAFRRGENYLRLLADTMTMLNAMTREQIFEKYPWATYDVKR